MRKAPVFDRVDLMLMLPDGTKERIVVYHEDDPGKVLLGEWEAAERLGGRVDPADFGKNT